MGWEYINDEKPLRWSEFLYLIKEDKEEVLRQREIAELFGSPSHFIYRGQSDSSWLIESSLERFLRENNINGHYALSMRSYYSDLARIVCAVNSLTDNRFPEFNPADIDFTADGRADRIAPHYELMCYARHHGFPTPLVDWSKSVYVAAFFAYSHCISGNNAAVYAYQEYSGDPRGGSLREPIINTHGHFVQTHSRHFRQQSVYTTCTSLGDVNSYHYRSHDDAVRLQPHNHRMKKFVLDGQDKVEALIDLNEMNINDYTLYNSEEGLMRKLAFEYLTDIDV